MHKNSYFSNINHTSTDNTASSKIPTRDEIDPKFKWNLSDIYENESAFETDYQKTKTLIKNIAAFKDNLKKTDCLLNCLKLRDELSLKASHLFAYARMHQDENAKNSLYQARTSKVESLLSEVSAATSFIEPELIALPEKYINSLFLQNTEFDCYKFYFEDLLRQKKHILSPIEEEILAKAGELLKIPTNIYSMLTNADMTFPEITVESGDKIQLSEGRYNALIRSTNRQTRTDAFHQLFNTYAKYRNTFSTTLTSNIKNTNFYAKTKKYNSSLEAALENDNVPICVYTNLIDTIHKTLHPLHKYVDLKKKFLQLDEIHMYDLYVPLAKALPDDIKYQEGLQLVLHSLKPLGENYVNTLSKGSGAGWIDLYENQGKRTGAYSWGVYGVHPFVLLNYDNKYGAVSTLAHELGHAMHSYYSNQSQNYINSAYTIFCAEVASTTNEILLLDYMLEHEADPTKRIYFINQYLEQVRTTVYRQAMFAEFELITHKKIEKNEALTADLLEELWLTLNKKYYGNTIVIDDAIKIEWARIPHFYRPFYVYQYVTGYAAATTLAENLINEGSSAQRRYLKYLQSGGSDYSIHLLKAAGVDMSTSIPLKITLEKFNKRLKELEELLIKA
ncbi:oligoendopeptidase F [Anaerosinus massiliensis]|uniref:oligoendopeptidase F n=1 Tax=Massilibacillus massiliensis TaxID=1806837 RepID=UPI000AF9A620|nr:oligoendopeptidase F [Massilibacillus massiliensis]